MEYRRLGRTELQVGVIGVGGTHLPRDREALDALLEAAADAGVNYIDACIPAKRYWNRVGEAFRRHRDRFIIAAHWSGGSPWPGTHQECQEQLDHMLSFLDRVDIGMISMVDEETKWHEWVPEAMERLQENQRQGRVGYLGLSTHQPAIGLMAARSGLIDVLMYPVNMLGFQDQQAKELLQTCAERDVGVVAMKPFWGGRLLDLEKRPDQISVVQCLAYVLDQALAAALPGVKTIEELRGVLAYLVASNAERDYRSVLVDLLDYWEEGRCTMCGHCLPCPVDVNITGLIGYMLHFARRGGREAMLGWYDGLEVKASECIECEECVPRCPFGVDIIGAMHELQELFES